MIGFSIIFPGRFFSFRTALIISWLPVFILSACQDQSLTEEIRQPLSYNHMTHVNDNMIPCEFCHVFTERSSVAGLPSVQVCKGCHSVIKGSKPDQQSEIKKIIEWDKDRSVPWKKIHDLPDFVYFSHKRHAKAGFGCFECHGGVNMMVAPVPFEKFGQTPLSMGWCLDCHLMEHPVLKVEPDILQNSKSRVTGKKPPDRQLLGTIKGPTDCVVCHK